MEPSTAKAVRSESGAVGKAVGLAGAGALLLSVDTRSRAEAGEG
jgi:hypothetical protein